MVDLPTDAPPKEDALAALDRVAPSKQQLHYDDKRHQREAGVIELQITKYYEDRAAERSQQRFLIIAVLIVLVGTFGACLWKGETALAEKILTAVLPTGAYALGTRKKFDDPKAPKRPDN